MTNLVLEQRGTTLFLSVGENWVANYKKRYQTTLCPMPLRMMTKLLRGNILIRLSTIRLPLHLAGGVMLPSWHIS